MPTEESKETENNKVNSVDALIEIVNALRADNKRLENKVDAMDKLLAGNIRKTLSGNDEGKEKSSYTAEQWADDIAKKYK